jgi:hypothetical protein
MVMSKTCLEVACAIDKMEEEALLHPEEVTGLRHPGGMESNSENLCLLAG